MRKDILPMMMEVYPLLKDNWEFWDSIDYDLKRIEKFLPRNRLTLDPKWVINNARNDREMINTMLESVLHPLELEIIIDNLRLEVL